MTLAFTTNTPYLFNSQTQSICNRHNENKKLLTTSTSVPQFSFVRTSTTCVVRSDSVKQNEDESKNDDDDESFGTISGRVLGMKLPNLSSEDEEYLNGAEDDKDFMQRMTMIAKRMDQTRLINNARTGKQTADDYLQNLNKVKMYRSEPDITPIEKEENNNVEDIDDKIKQLNNDLINAMNNNLENDSSKNEINQNVLELDENMKEIEKLQKQIQQEIGNQVSSKFDDMEQLEKELENKNFDNVVDSSTIEKQIQYIESHLQKLRNDAQQDEKKQNENTNETLEETREKGLELLKKAKEKVTSMNFNNIDEDDDNNNDKQNKSDSKIDGLQDTPGGMSAEEKRQAFEALRRQAMQQKGEMNQFADPLNVTLPSKKKDLSPNFQHDDYEIDPFEEANRNVMNNNDDGDVPRGDESEYDSFADSSLNKKLLIEEIEMEMKSYTDESRRLLRNHESRMSTLLSRLITLEE